MTKPVKQKDKSDCAAAVAAMLTSTTMADFKKEHGPTPKLGYWNTNVFDYAKKHNLFLDNWYEKKYFRGRLRKYQKAYITVVSERDPKKLHAIYWDGHSIYDPSPKTKNGRDIKTYDVVMVVYFTTNK